MSARRQNRFRHAGFTLLELLLSLGLIVLATALIGYLMQTLSRNFATRGEDIRRMQLARSLLGRIAEDVRSVVTEQEHDASVLQRLLGSSGGGSSAGGSSGAAGSGEGGSDNSGQQSGGDFSGGDSPGGAMSGASGQFGGSPGGSQGVSSSGSNGEAAGAGIGDSDLSETATASIPPGLYGSQYQLMVDVSRVPRPDEYRPQQASIFEGTLTDVPGDMKTVTYFVQSETNQGVRDSLDELSDASGSSGFTSGLVRRQLDRRVTAYAEQTGDVDRLTRTGDLLAPEVIALEFAYFDGTEWLYSWDSSTQSLPWLVQISLAIQSASGSQTAKLEPGIPISTLSYDQRVAYGIEVYELVVAIPGAQLRASDAAAGESGDGMDSLGL